MEPLINFKPEIYQEPKKLAELQLGVRNFCGDFNARLTVSFLKLTFIQLLDQIQSSKKG